MILPFSTQLNGKPTLFPEKILNCFLKEYDENENNNFKDTPEFIYQYGEFAGYLYADTALEKVEKAQPKLHTIREDKKNRWKAGTIIDFFINCRQKNMFRFAPQVPVVSVQKIEIRWFDEYPKKIHGCTAKIGERWVSIRIDNKHTQSCLKPYSNWLKNLSQNDGFDTVEDFFDYFNKDFTGKLIHWTNKRY